MGTVVYTSLLSVGVGVREMSSDFSEVKNATFLSVYELSWDISVFFFLHFFGKSEISQFNRIEARKAIENGRKWIIGGNTTQVNCNKKEKIDENTREYTERFLFILY